MNRGKTANRTAKGKDRSGSGWLSRAVKGGVLGLAATIFCILAFAVAVQTIWAFRYGHFGGQPDNQGGVYLPRSLCCRQSSPENKLLAGAGAGAAYVILGYLAFSLIQSRWGKVRLLLADLGMGLLIGALTGIIFARLGAGNPSAFRKTTAGSL